ncbi:MAG: GNAT family N-acetyltransferase [Kiloniellales bacterium]|nr:GNAT family N-acetyltransferase [Kiloniellales bacterium]
MPDCLLRHAVKKDMAVIARMMDEFNSYLASIDGRVPEIEMSIVEEKLIEAGFGPTAKFRAAVAEIDGEPVGYSIYSIGFWAEPLVGVVELSDLFVRESWRSKGIGEKLMAFLAEVGREEACRKIRWTVWTRNEGAKRFYQRLGAEVVEEEETMVLAIPE